MGIGVLRRILPLIAGAGLAACSGNYDGQQENGSAIDEGRVSEGPLEPRIESIQDHVFTPHCVSCHSGATARNGLRLDDAQTSYDNLVNVRATEFPALFRVEPGNPDDSYLIHKLEGTQEVGDRMPLGQPPLSAETIAVIRDWITQGAPPPQGEGAPPSPLLPPVELGAVPGA